MAVMLGRLAAVIGTAIGFLTLKLVCGSNVVGPNESVYSGFYYYYYCYGGKVRCCDACRNLMVDWARFYCLALLFIFCWCTFYW